MIHAAHNEKLLPKLSKHLFWDYDISALNEKDDKELIFERVFTRGLEKDEKALFSYYKKEDIKNTAVKIRNLDKKTLNYLSVILGIPKKVFKCYKQTQLAKPFGIPY
jgi:nicotinamide mononucleotide adenylyltransferase